MEPEDGECPDGYELQDDGMCHLMPMEDAQAEHADTGATAEQVAADRDALAVALALSE